jgi:hypothetical protein
VLMPPSQSSSGTVVLQSSTLSVAIFILKTSSIRTSPIQSEVFTWTFLTFYRLKNINSVEWLLQLCLNIIQKWVDENGFQFSIKLKLSACIFVSSTFCIQTHNSLWIACSYLSPMNSNSLALSSIKKLNFIPHIKYSEIAA